MTFPATLDRYLLRQFATTLAFAVGTFLALSLVVDIIEHLDSFLDQHATGGAILRYYLYSIPAYLVLPVMPVATLMATLFSLGLLARQNEIVAMKAAGVSLYRLVFPLYLFALGIAVTMTAFGEWVVPAANRLKADVREREIEKTRYQTVLLANLYVQGTAGRIFHFQTYDPQAKFARQVLVQRFVNGKLAEEVDAQRMLWSGRVWILEDGHQRKFPLAVDSVAPDTFRAFLRLERPDFTEKPEELVERQRNPQLMGYRDLKRYVKLKERSGELATREKVDLHLKLAFPLINFISVLFGAPLVTNPRKSGLALSFGITLTIAFLYYIASKFVQVAGYNQKLPPFVAAWLTNVVFAVGGFILLWRARK